MQKDKRLRIFCGPNGSGKSTLFNKFKEQYNPGYFINADELEKDLNSSGLIDLQPIGITATSRDLMVFSKTKEAKSLSGKAVDEGHNIDIEIKENFIVDKAKDSHSYEASFAAAFIRQLLYKSNASFSFETVMSHRSKITEIKKAKKNGYKIYLYFICTDDIEININRISNRVEQGGHAVSKNKISSRYGRTLENLYDAVKLSNRVYLFDNSGKTLELIAEIFDGALQLKVDILPNWFVETLLPHYEL